MKLVKIQEGTTQTGRAVNNVELITRYLFGNNFPSKFIANNYYKSGDFAYDINDDGSITLYQCLVTNEYEYIDARNWVVASVDASVKDYISMLVKGFFPDQRFAINIESTVYRREDLIEIEENKVYRLPSGYKYDSNIIVYVNGLYVSSSVIPADYTVTKVGRYYHIIFNQGIPEDASITMYIRTPKNHNAKLFMYTDERPETMDLDTNTFTFYLNNIVATHSYTMTLFIEGLYIPPTWYTSSYDSDTNMVTVIMKKLPDNIIVTDESVVMSFTASRSKAIMVGQSHDEITIDDFVKTYRLDLSNEIRMSPNTFVYYDYINIPSDMVSIDDSVLSLHDREYYGEVDHEFCVIENDWSIDVNSVDVYYDELVVCAGERRMPIPILNYSPELYDVIVCKKSGSVISKSRYYISDGYINFYDHEDSIVEDDVLCFHLLNRDGAIDINNVVTSISGDLTATIPVSVLDPDKLVIMAFTTTGLYIPRNTYTVENRTISFTSDSSVKAGDTIEFLLMEYIKAYTFTIEKQEMVNIGSINTVKLPFSNFDETTDNVLLFNNTTKTYICPSTYNITLDGIAKINQGTGVVAGDTVDVYLFRKIEKPIYTSAIPHIGHLL